MNNIKNNAIDEYCLEFGIEAARDSEKITRLAFTVITIVSLAIILVTWNAYYSWYTDFSLEIKLMENPVTEVVHKALLNQWIESTAISFPFLGIKVGVFDGAVVGSFILFVLTVWFFLCVRRQRQVISNFLKNTTTSKWDAVTRKWVYFGITSYISFINIVKIDKAIHRKEKWQPEKPFDFLMQKTFKWLVYLPPITIFLLIISDILSVFYLPAYFRYPHDSLFAILQFDDKIKLTLMEIWAFAFMLAVMFFCNKVISYILDTGSILYKYAEDIKKELHGHDLD